MTCKKSQFISLTKSYSCSVPKHFSASSEVCVPVVLFSWSISSSEDGVNVPFSFLEEEEMVHQTKIRVTLLHMTTYSNHGVPGYEAIHVSRDIFQQRHGPKK